ncbi:hypothetical protein GCM10012320_34360 [Sinomonas cellulolyticus]|uniref:S1 motif domain-containing protein n=1 Tax=Sinomonas cellulolyticus TaxID=2801916 RepID=A0ABS1K9H2_9MICC|nr:MULTISPECIES: hypothetical protein [Sinomonas]MBL0706961.1 hypothetical protein [Sinomonas cellulolyticus]GHG59974.1 hypothetical protein GCM10012320_34360 [Sinomonas sp. KCTC 49339]
MAPAPAPQPAGEAIAREILRPGRRHPVVVVSQNRQFPEAVIDARSLERDLNGIAAVYVIDDTAAHGLPGRLPSQADVYGNAARVYEPRALADGRPPRFPPRVAFDRRSAWDAGGKAIDDARACAAPKDSPSAAGGPRTVDATVHGFLQGGQHALARTAEGSLATIDADRTVPGIPLDWYLSPGQRVTGKVLPGGQIDISSMLLGHRLSLVYPPGSTVLALARNVTAAAAELTLFPGTAWTVPAPDGIAAEGEVVCALYTHDRGAVRLSLTDAADEPTAEAPPLVADGPPWLVLGRSLHPSAPEPEGPAAEAAPPADPAGSTVPGTDGSSGPAPGPDEDPTAQDGVTDGPLPGSPEAGTGPARQQAQADPRPAAPGPAGARPGPAPLPRPGTVHVAPSAEDLEEGQTRLAAELRHVLQEGAELRRQLDIAQDEIRHLRAEAAGLRKKLKAQARAAAPRTGLFADPLDGLRHEIYTTWASYLGPFDKDRYPAPSGYSIGPELPGTLDALQDPADREKALETIVDLLVHRVERQRTMAIKPLLSTKRRQHQRWDGALAWRVRIENRTAAALRLHYWALPDGSVELWTVNSHDDYPRSTADSGPALLVG